MPYLIKPELFAEGQSLVEFYQAAKELPMPKLNIKIRTSDLRIIDSIAAQSGTPRSQIMNSIIESVLLKMLQDMAEDNEDCAALVAKQADGNYFLDRGSWSDRLFFAREKDVGQYYGPSFDEKRKLDGFIPAFHSMEERFGESKP